MRRLNERGAVAAEFALLLPVILLILFGTIEFGMIMYSREVITNASREGARAGIVQVSPKPTAGAITTIATTYLTGTGINPANVTIAVTGAGAASVSSLHLDGREIEPKMTNRVPPRHADQPIARYFARR